MSDKEKEKKVFSQELNRDDLKAAAGGSGDQWTCHEVQVNDCIHEHVRQLYGGKGFPNCANTVEDGSNCDDADACISWSVAYKGFKGGCIFSDCYRSWR